jgi:LmbE family N-acetylglucosaminyl deacetylase
MRVNEEETDGSQGAVMSNNTEQLTTSHSHYGSTRPSIDDPKVNSNSRVLVLAPHHDDPVFGCGGTMCKLAKRGAHVKVLYMTDYSYESNIGPSSGLVPIVPKEAKESLAKLRCFESEHLELPCLGLHCDPDSRRRLTQAIDYYSPNLVFIPSLQDIHPDNMMTGLLAAHALRGHKGCLTLYSYEVWGGLFPNTMVEITDVMEDKIAAMNERRSQARLVDGERRVREANTYSLSTMQSVRYCEPFLRQEQKDFVTMAGRLGAYNLAETR